MIPPSVWHNGGRRLLKILIGISCVVLLLVSGVALGIFVLTDRVTKLKENQSDITALVDANTKAIKDYEKAINEGWQKFQEHNPAQPVPQVVPETDPKKGEKLDVVVIPAKATPKPTALPKEPRVRTRKVYVRQPTPWPWWKAKPQPTPKK